MVISTGSFLTVSFSAYFFPYYQSDTKLQKSNLNATLQNYPQNNQHERNYLVYMILQNSAQGATRAATIK